jgi:predicted amino acid dehydrogenase
LISHQIRVAPTLSDPFTLRLEPSAYIREEDIHRVFAAMNDLCARLQNNDGIGLTAYLMDRDPTACSEPAYVRPGWKFFAYDDSKFRQRERSTPAVRVAWLCHLVDANDLVALEPTFGDVPFEMREEYLHYFSTLANPVLMSAVDVRSRTGDKVRLFPIMLPVSSRWMKRCVEARNFGTLRSLVQKGIDVASFLGCSIISLGQYTSIATLHGRSLASCKIGVTTGNSYTIALAIQAIRRAHNERGCDSSKSVLAVAGAAGNIGRACAEILAPHYKRTILVGSNKSGSLSRLKAISSRVPNSKFTTELSAISDADVVVVAMNTVDAPLGPDHFARNAIVCDMSVPPSVRPDAWIDRPDLLIFKGGIVRLPFADDLEIVGFPLPPRYTYGCMAEGILLGLEGIKDATFTGPITPERVRHIEEVAQRHGFELADYKTACVLGSELQVELHAARR